MSVDCTELRNFTRTCAGKSSRYNAEMMASCAMETWRIPDYYCFLAGDGKLISPLDHSEIRDSVKGEDAISQLERQAIDFQTKWANKAECGDVAIWVSPPADCYPFTKLIVSELEMKGSQRIVVNRAVILDVKGEKCAGLSGARQRELAEEECLQVAHNLEGWCLSHPFLSSLKPLEAIRGGLYVLKPTFIHWSYILENEVQDLNLETVRTGEDRLAKEKALVMLQELLERHASPRGADMRAVAEESAQMGLFGMLPSSCPELAGLLNGGVMFAGLSPIFRSQESSGGCKEIKCGKVGCGWKADEDDLRKIKSGEMTCCPDCGWKP